MCAASRARGGWSGSCSTGEYSSATAGKNSDAITAVSSTPATIASEAPIGMCYQSAINIFAPTKTRTTDRPICRKRKVSMTPASRKYSERSPRMAQMFEV